MAGRKASQKPATLDFALTRGHWVTGKLVNARTGKPEADAPRSGTSRSRTSARTNRSPARGPGRMEPTTYTAEDGTFRVVAFACRGAIVANGLGGGYIAADQRPLQGDVASLDPGEADAHTLPTSPAVESARTSRRPDRATSIRRSRSEYTITLDPGATVKVKLVDADGKPVTGAGVGGLSTWSLVATRIRRRKSNSRSTTRTGRDPSCSCIPGEGLGKLVEPKKGDVGPWDVKLEPAGTATGRLVTVDGKPVANAVLQVHYRCPGTTPGRRRRSRQGADGRGRASSGSSNLVGGLTYSVQLLRRAGTDAGCSITCTFK